MERHHTLWTRKEFYAVSPLSKQVRQLSAFILDVHQPNHRLLHAKIKPPEVPDHETLLEMRSLSVGGLSGVIKHLDHPIVGHFEQQLEIITLDPEVAWRMIDLGLHHLPLGEQRGKISRRQQ